MTRVHTLPSGTMALALQSAGLTTSDSVEDIVEGLIADSMPAPEAPATNHAYFDPQDMIEDLVTEPSAVAALRSSLVWIANARVIGQARNIYYNMHKEAVEAGKAMGTLDGYADFNNAIRACVDQGNSLAEMGLPESGISVLRNLIGLRSEWSDLAMQSALAADLSYREPDLEEMIDSPMPINAIALEKEIALCTAMLQDDGADQSEIKEGVRLVRLKAQNNYKANAAQTKTIAPAIRMICCQPGAQALGGKFWELPLEAQVSFISSIRRSAKKTIETLTKIRSVSTHECITGARQLRKLDGALTEVQMAKAKLVN